MTRDYTFVLFEDNINSYNITNYEINQDNNKQILYSIRAGDDVLVKNTNNLKELENKISDKILFIPNILKSGFYSLEEIKKKLDFEKISINYPTSIIGFIELIDDYYSELSDLIFLEYIYEKMIKNNSKMVHIIYE
jgi:hypothetical protein